MIPTFPQFKKLELSDKTELEVFTQKHPPYSDYNFVSLWSWDIDEKAEISNLNGNLVVKFHDYITQDPFYTFLGTNHLIDTLNQLFSFSKEKGAMPHLKLIPEVVVEELKSHSHNWIVEEDIDSHDYVLSIDNLMTMAGNKLGGKRNFINRFKRFYELDTVVQLLDIKNKEIQDQISSLFQQWEVQKDKPKEETINEERAIKRIFKGAEHLNLSPTGIFVKEKLIAFSINEVTHSKYGVIHYEKADTSYIGSYAFLKQQSAIYLKQLGCDYINYEQDLGLEPLRHAKAVYQPIFFLKKYIIKDSNA